MRSKTSCFEKTIFKKDLTRFAPLWGMYLLCLVLGMVILYSDAETNETGYLFAFHMNRLTQSMALINLIYALLAAGALFSDLFNSRMCCGIHALPLRRETWFLTHLISGLFFSLVPTLLAALVAAPLLAGTKVIDAWIMAPMWFLATNLQYLCCFGMALLCVHCAGNYLGLGGLYLLLQGGAYLCYAIIDDLYTPLLYGVITPSTLVETLTPLAVMANGTYFDFPMTYSQLYNAAYQQGEAFTTTYTICWEAFGQLGLLALAGAGFALAALVLYRRRKVERAGDLLAFPVLEPVIQVAAAIAGAYFAYYVARSVSFVLVTEKPVVMYLVLFLGLAVGWFGAQMVIRRSTRVFQPKVIGGLGILTGALALSLGLTCVDVLGISSWVPDRGEVTSVSMDYRVDGLSYTDPQDIDAMIRLHRLALEDPLKDAEGSGEFQVDETGQIIQDPDAYSGQTQTRRRGGFFLTYQLSNGRTVQRCYYIWTDTEAGDIYREYASRPEYLAYGDEQLAGFLDGTIPLVDIQQVESVNNSGYYVSDREILAAAGSEEALEQLRQAVLADCEDRTMAQDASWHTGYFQFRDQDGDNLWREINLQLEFPEGKYSWRKYSWISIFPDSENTVAWLKAYNLLSADVLLED